MRSWIERTLAGLSIVALSATALASSGCLFEPEPRREEPYAWVRLVGKAPPADRWEPVGRVEGVAPDVGFVEAVKLARLDIRQKAALMGASIVRIQRVQVPPPAHHSLRAHVLLVGRAYRPVERARHGARPRG